MSASSINHQLFIVPESTYGTTPANPTLTELPIIGTTLAVSYEMMPSKTIRASRVRKDLIQGMKSVNGEITAELAPTNFDVVIEAVLCGTWAGTNPKTVSNGLTRRSFSAVRKFPDMASGDTHNIFVGMEFNNMSITLGTKDVVGAKFSVIAKDGSIVSGAPSGSTFPALANVKPFSGLSMQVSEGGSATGIITELNLSIENGLEVRPALGSDTTRRPKIGFMTVSGSMTMYFETMAILSKLYASTDTDLSFVLSQNDIDYEFELPRIKLTDGKPDVQETNDITLTVPFTALYDTTSQHCITVTKTAA